MKPFIKELFEYTHHYNKFVIFEIIENQNKVSEKTIELISHIINVHQIWNAKFNLNSSELLNAWTIQEITNLPEYERINFNKSIEILAKYKLDDLIEWKTSNGKLFRNRVQDILFQIINHSNYHRAQIATEFKKNGLNPIMSDFIFYKMTKSQ